MPRILVVDDELTMRSLLSDVLTKMGYEVFLSEDGDHALQILTQNPGIGDPGTIIILQVKFVGGTHA